MKVRTPLTDTLGGMDDLEPLVDPQNARRYKHFLALAGVAQLARACACQAQGRRFDPGHPLSFSARSCWRFPLAFRALRLPIPLSVSSRASAAERLHDVVEPAGRHVGVALGHAGVGVAEHLGDVLDGDALRAEPGGGRVAEVVEAEVGDPRRREPRLEDAGVPVAGVERAGSARVREQPLAAARRPPRPVDRERGAGVV